MSPIVLSVLLLILPGAALASGRARPAQPRMFQLTIARGVDVEGAALDCLLPKGLKGMGRTMESLAVGQYRGAAGYLLGRQSGPVSVLGTADHLILLPEEFYRLPQAARVTPAPGLRRQRAHPAILLTVTGLAVQQMGGALMDEDWHWAYFALNHAFENGRVGRHGIAVDVLEDPRLNLDPGPGRRGGLKAARKEILGEAKAANENGALEELLRGVKAGDKAMTMLEGAGHRTYEPVTIGRVTKDKIYTDNGPGNDPTVFSRGDGAHENNGVIAGFNLWLRPIPPGGIPEDE